MPPTSSAERLPVVLVDRVGYDFYRDLDGRAFLPADRYAVRLVTDTGKVGQAHGAELESVLGVPAYDERCLADAVRVQSALGGRRARALVAVTERFLLPVARLREELGIPGPSVAEVLPFRDKIVMKRVLAEHGVAVPEAAPFTMDAARDLLRRHPVVVVKPRTGYGSTDISIVRDGHELERFRAAHADRVEQFEVEQFVPGQMYHVDSLVQDGRVLAAVAGRYLEETTSYLRLRPNRDIAVAPGPLLDSLLDFNQRVLACFPGFSGASHHEVFVTGAGIVCCEIAARAGGGGVIAGFRSRTGVNLDEAVLQGQLTGTVPSPGEVAGHLTGFIVIYAGAGIIREPIEPPDQPWVIEAQILATAGERRVAPRNCNDAVAIVSVRGDSEAEVEHRLAVVRDTITPKLAPRR